MNPNDFSQYLLLGEHYYCDGNFNFAERMLKQALLINPNHAKANELLAYIYLHHGEKDGALTHLQIATKQIDCSTQAFYQLGSLQLSLHIHHEAITSLKNAIHRGGLFFEAAHDLATAYASTGDLEQALFYYQKCLDLNSHSFELQFNIGRLYDYLNRPQEALNHYQKAIELKPDFAEAWSTRGCALHDLGLYEDALKHFEHALKINPNDYLIWFNKALTLSALKEFKDALLHFEEATRLNSNAYQAWSNKGLTLIELKHFEESLVCFDRALALEPDFAQSWSNKGHALYQLKRHDEALQCIDKAIELEPDFAEAWSNKGLVQHDLRQFNDAIISHSKSLEYKPHHSKTWLNFGLTLNEKKRHEEALHCFDKAIELEPDLAEAWSNKGIVLYELKRFEDAIKYLQKALQLDESISWLAGDLIHIQMRCAIWINLKEKIQTITNQALSEQRSVQPFTMLSLTDAPELQKRSAKIYCDDRYPTNSSLGDIALVTRKNKIRLGYFSPDFKGHAVSFLCSELFKLHDRNQFEVIAFSFRSISQSDEITEQLKKSFDQFIDVENMSDLDVAKLSRTMGIDIAVDLAGHTQYARTGIFSYRAAPIQVNWLGYAGTIGADYIDYLVADPIVIPPSNQELFFEKIVYLPHSYLVDDPNRLPTKRNFNRDEFDLPEDAFVFCCLNNDYKFNEAVLDVWSEILHKAPQSVLWLSENNVFFQKNIKSEFTRRQIDGSRIIFAKRMESMGDHLARYQLADLFLDTFPYNAHSTAIDSLKAGVPILTRIGQSFPSRVAASLLNAIELPELITTSIEGYVGLALELALNPSKTSAIKQKLNEKIHSAPLFNTPLFTQNLEKAYLQMFNRYHSGKEPIHFSV